MPVQSSVPAPAAAEEALAELAAHAASLQAASGGNLLECFASVPDPRDARGIRHSLASVLALCTAAVLCGHTSIEDITAWVAAAPQQVLAAAGCRRNTLGVCVPPHPDTVVRIFTALGAQALASHAGAFLARRARQDPVTFPVAGPGWLPAIAADGKAMRGAIGEDGQVPYLLAAAVHGAGTVIAERLIGPKTNEVPELAPLLRELNQYYCLAGHVITLDALHTVRAHATLICEELLAHYVMTVKQNTPRLYDALDTLDWASVPVQHEVTETGHGRRERRTIQVMDAPAEIRKRFPHVRQAALIERYVTRKVRKRKKGSRKYKTTVRQSKFGKTRLLPLHPTTVGALRDYLRLRDRLHPHPGTPAVFISPAGTRLLYCNVHATWKLLVASAGLRPRSAACRPRIHDYADCRVMPTSTRRRCSEGVNAQKLSA